MAKKEISRPQTANIPPFGLRMQPELKERIEAAATTSGRSMNAEIVQRLEESFAKKDSDAAVFQKLLDGQVVELTNRVALIDLRLAMAKTQLDSALVRGRLVARDLELVEARASHPDNDTILRAAKTESDLIQAEVKRVEEEKRDILKARQSLLDEIERVREVISNGRIELEMRINR